jgi:hypothetical protein
MDSKGYNPYMQVVSPQEVDLKIGFDKRSMKDLIIGTIVTVVIVILVKKYIFSIKP